METKCESIPNNSKNKVCKCQLKKKLFYFLIFNLCKFNSSLSVLSLTRVICGRRGGGEYTANKARTVAPSILTAGKLHRLSTVRTVSPPARTPEAVKSCSGSHPAAFRHRTQNEQHRREIIHELPPHVMKRNVKIHARCSQPGNQPG